MEKCAYGTVRTSILSDRGNESLPAACAKTKLIEPDTLSTSPRVRQAPHDKVAKHASKSQTYRRLFVPTEKL